jgi:aryl-alcohol dehydrogenase-like predicted oxidoreductase
MEYLKLGQSDLEVSRIGFGCWAIGGHGYGWVDDQESIGAIHKACDLGINFFDTADVYGFGRSEEVLAKALGRRRHDVVIATKFGVCWDANGKTYKNTRPETVIKALEGSLRRLKVDQIPLYQIHWHDGETPIADTMEALLKCRNEGKIRHIGCSNLSWSLIAEAREYGSIIAIQSLFNVIQRETESLLRDCSTLFQMGTVSYGALARGLFSGKYNEETAFSVNDTRSTDDNFQGSRLSHNLLFIQIMKEIGMYYDKSSAQVALRWILDSPFITSVMVGSKNAKQVTENVGALGWHLAEEHWRLLDYLSGKSDQEKGK